MANPTKRVKNSRRAITDTQDNVSLKGGTLVVIQQGEMIGRRTDGFSVPFDDAGDFELQGISVHSGKVEVLAADADGAVELLVDRIPFELKITGVVQGDIGKAVYALFSNEGDLDPTNTTNENLIGKVLKVRGTDVALVTPLEIGEQANIADASGVATAEDVECRVQAAANTLALKRAGLIADN